MKSLFSIVFLLFFGCRAQSFRNAEATDTVVAKPNDTLEISPFLVDYIGEFTLGRYISAKEGKLFYQSSATEYGIPLNQIGKDIFHLEDNKATIRFIRNNSNQVMAFRIVWVGGKKETCERKGPAYMAK
jgi:hypothetical protein